jgi:hypothetical protein
MIGMAGQGGIPMPYNTSDFIAEASKLDLPDLVRWTERELADAERRAPPRRRSRHAPDTDYIRRGYIENLKGLLFWLGSGKRPAGISPETFRTFRPIAEALVAKGQFLPSALADFEEPAPRGNRPSK